MCHFGALWSMAARSVNVIEGLDAKFGSNNGHNFDKCRLVGA